MNKLSLTKATKLIRLRPDGAAFNIAAGQTNINSDVVDMAGFNAVRFIVGFGTITAGGVQSVKAQDGAAANLSDAADLLGSGTIVADTQSGKLVSLDYIHPTKRYLRLSILRATQNSVIDFVVAELYRARTEPTAIDPSVTAAKLVANPGEGAA